MNGPVAFVFATTVVPFFLLLFFYAFVPAGFLALPDEIVDSFVYLFQTAKAWDTIVPVITLIYGLGIMLAIDGVILIWRAFAWIVGVITGAGR